MPTLDEALRFVRDPRTSGEQLRRACRILSLDATGEPAALRARLLQHLDGLTPREEVVCLNPNVPLA